MSNLYLKAELDELKTKHVALASKYIKLKDRTRQKLSAAKKVMQGTLIGLESSKSVCGFTVTKGS